jgi:hypothetical protein
LKKESKTIAFQSLPPEVRTAYHLYEDPTKTTVRLAFGYAVRNPPYFAQKIIEYSALGFGATAAFLTQKNILFSKPPSQDTKFLEIKVPEIKDHHL